MNWWQSNEELLASSPRVICESRSGALFASSVDGLQVSRDDGETWTVSDSTRRVSEPGIVDSQGTIFASGSTGMFRSTSDGATWTTLSLDISPYFVSACTITPDGFLFAGISNGEVFRSTDAGMHWMMVRSGDGRGFVDAMLAHPNGTLYINRSNSIAWSTNSGNTWHESNGLPRNYSITSLVLTNSLTLLAGTFYGGIYRSEDGGNTWTESNTGLVNKYIFSLSKSADGSIYTSAGQYVFRSTDNGKTWEDISSGIRALFVTQIWISSKGYAFAGTQYYGLYRSINIFATKLLPRIFALSQHYPNPFNSQTTIEFSLPNAGQTRLTIYNALGQKITELLSAELVEGPHRII
jgi:photosystem II stability/assembly factor-like uncharacterized protein